MTYYGHARAIQALAARAQRRRLAYVVGPDDWERLRDSFERSYVEGRLSDNEHDDLLNRWMGFALPKKGEPKSGRAKA